MDGLVSKSDRFGHRYDGRHHSQYANSIKKYTLASKRPLNRAEQSQLVRLLQNFYRSTKLELAKPDDNTSFIYFCGCFYPS